MCGNVSAARPIKTTFNIDSYSEIFWTKIYNIANPPNQEIIVKITVEKMTNFLFGKFI